MKVFSLSCLLFISLCCVAQSTFAQAAPPYGTGTTTARYNECQACKNLNRSGLSWINFSKAGCEHACEGFDSKNAKNKGKPDPCATHHTNPISGGAVSNCAEDCKTTYPKSTAKEESCKECCTAACKK